MRWFHATAIAALSLALGARAESGNRAPAREGFEAIQKVAAARDAEVLDVVIPSALVEKRPGFAGKMLQDWRIDLAKRLTSRTVLDAREEGDAAVVRLKGEVVGEETELPLRWGGSRWVVDAAQDYVVKGKSLDRANGKKPQKVHLTARTTNGEYGKSAYSFAHVTQDPEASKNRMEIWYCHNGDLHLSGEDVAIEDDGKKGIPLGEWKELVHPSEGATYVVRSRHPERRDFYVRLKAVVVKPEAVDLEWSLLTTGWNSPPNIHEEQPLVSQEGKDGADGLCGKRAGS